MLSMPAIEFACVLIVLGALVVRLRAGARAATALDLAAVAAAAWVGEDTCIRAYGFYAYAPGWTAFLDRVPLLIVVIWPVVVFSSRAIVTAFLPDAPPLLHAAATGLLVTVDASFIEPVATALRLWGWAEPGLFHVPPVGILGWGFFAASVSWCLARPEGPRRPLALFLAPACTHVLLLATWWGLLRWVNGAVPLGLALAWAALVSSGGVVLAVRRREAVRRIGLAEMLSRLAAALFFYGLLFGAAEPGRDLAAYALVFAAPYTLLLGLQKRSSGSPAHRQTL
ncbi:MAG: carotenoid biosynthesis protein [Planctomycetes bacterium]|nr:carotenoid biosynthesis protein [Planctomycetota bacterium]